MHRSFLMEVTTKVKEFKLMAQGNKAVSYVLGGRLLGLAIVYIQQQLIPFHFLIWFRGERLGFWLKLSSFI